MKIFYEINKRLYSWDGGSTRIAVYLTNRDKENIANMPPENDIYAEAPIYTSDFEEFVLRCKSSRRPLRRKVKQRRSNVLIPNWFEILMMEGVKALEEKVDKFTKNIIEEDLTKEELKEILEELVFYKIVISGFEKSKLS